ncbi:D-ribose ABC transporter substrate-binding protein [Oenococcus sicerae]|uniref:D-ribose ABC transporter substrate-binding protein n=1 Tax=Oenococcus sicerae TaxID=2203724 RepID=UPI0010B01F19|nr:Ribose import binding protein RbsB {ECO:0000305} precursor [Oenococcus sicerae]
MLKKKSSIISLGLVIVILLSLFISGKPLLTLRNPWVVADQNKKINAKDIKIGVSLSTMNNPFFISVADGIKAEAKNQGVKGLIIDDGKNDTSKQSNDIEDLIQQQVDVLIINPVDSDAVTPEVKEANQAGIPVITIDRSSTGGKVLSLVSSDSVLAGKMAADFMFKAVGQNAKVAELQGTPGASAARDRGKGFEEASKGKLNIVAKQTANFDRSQGLSVAENIIQGHTDLKGIFAQNDEMALGTAQAVNGNNIVIIGIDGEADGLAAVKSGKMSATVAQHPEEMGKLAVQTVIKHFKGKKVAKWTKSPVALVVNDKYKNLIK